MEVRTVTLDYQLQMYVILNVVIAFLMAIKLTKVIIVIFYRKKKLEDWLKPYLN